MDIVFCTDNNYVMPCGIAITSLLENNKGESVTIHIIGLDLNKQNISRLESIEQRYEVIILFYNIDQNYLSQFNLPFHKKAAKHITIAAYVRLFLADILPITLDKVIYLDADVMIVDSLSDFWHIDISKHSIGGIVDHNAFIDSVYQRLKYSPTYSYINSGVMLINLSYWRANKVTNQFIEYVKNNIDNIIYHDQDIINGVLYDSTLMCPYRFNMHKTFYSKKFCNEELYGEDLHVARMNPAIIHYTSRSKPWHKDSFSIYGEEYLYYKSLTDWKKEPLRWTDSSLSRKIKYYKRIVFKFAGVGILSDRIDENKYMRK